MLLPVFSGDRGGQHSGELLRWGLAPKSQREAIVVVRLLPSPEPCCRLVEIGELLPAPKLFLVDAVAAFDLAVLLRPPRADIAVPDTGRFDGEHELERELASVVALQFPD